MLKSLIGATLLTMGVGVSTPTPNFIKRSGTVNTSKSFTPSSTNLVIDNTTTIGNYYTSFEVNGTFDTNEGELTLQNAYITDNTNYYLLEDNITNDLDVYNNWVEREQTFQYNCDNIDIMAFKWNGSTIAQNAKLTFTYNSNLRMPIYYQNMNLPKINLKYFVIIGKENLENYYNRLIDNQAPRANKEISQALINEGNTSQNTFTYYENVELTTNKGSWYTIEQQEVEIDINYLNYGETSYIFVLSNAYFYTAQSSLQWRVIDTNQMAANTYTNLKLEYFIPSTNINYEVINIPGLIFTILTTPFAFISQAFNLTIFPGTPYALNISALLLAIIGIGMLFVILKIVMRRM